MDNQLPPNPPPSEEKQRQIMQIENDSTLWFDNRVWSVMKEMAREFQQSGALPKNMTVQQALMAIQAGREIGMMPVAAHAQKTIKLAHLNKNDPFDNGTGAMAVVFKSLVESGTNGAVKVDIFPDGQLGKDNEVIQQVKSGVVQSSISSVGGIASVYPMIGVLDVPFAFTERKLTEVREGDDRDYLQGSRDIHEDALDLQRRVREVLVEAVK